MLILVRIEQREKFSRQKPVNEEEDITYINERNRHFNEKIDRYYGKYTKEIRENFERGTAYVDKHCLLLVCYCFRSTIYLLIYFYSIIVCKYIKFLG